MAGFFFAPGPCLLSAAESTPDHLITYLRNTLRYATENGALTVSPGESTKAICHETQVIRHGPGSGLPRQRARRGIPGGLRVKGRNPGMARPAARHGRGHGPGWRGRSPALDAQSVGRSPAKLPALPGGRKPKARIPPAMPSGERCLSSGWLWLGALPQTSLSPARRRGAGVKTFPLLPLREALSAPVTSRVRPAWPESSPFGLRAAPASRVRCAPLTCHPLRRTRHRRSSVTPCRGALQRVSRPRWHLAYGMALKVPCRAVEAVLAVLSMLSRRFKILLPS